LDAKDKNAHEICIKLNLMKYLFFFTALLLAVNCQPQTQPHVLAAPPVNPSYPFIRSLSVDCSDQILSDMTHGSQTGMENDLLDFISDNYIKYVILRDLENANVFGDPVNEATLHQLIGDIRSIDPAIQVGLCASASAIFKSDFIIKPDDLKGPCFGEVLKPILNQGSFSDLPTEEKQKVAISSLYIKVSLFENDADSPDKRKKCHTNFDALYLDYPYWNTTSSMTDMQNQFQHFKDILKIMRSVKCHSSCIRFIDAEFLPSDQFMLQGWTAIDQITDADTLIDRVVIPSYTSDPYGVFNRDCKLMHFLSDRFSKTGTKILMKMSAESPGFSYCNSNLQPNDYLGDYLNGSVTPNGNMFSVEDKIIAQYNDINNVCPACHCSTYVENHYNTNNIWGNNLNGSIWGPYTMMNGNHLFRKTNHEIVLENDFIPVKVVDALGREYGIYRDQKIAIEKIEQFEKGIYYLISGDKKSVYRK
jgi:hypothetical protein